MSTAVAICFSLERQEIARAFSRAWAKTGKRIAARMAMIAMTTRSSMRVNPLLRRDMVHLLVECRPHRAGGDYPFFREGTGSCSGQDRGRQRPWRSGLAMG